MPRDSQQLDLIETEADETLDTGTIGEVEGILADAFFESWLLEQQEAGRLPVGRVA